MDITKLLEENHRKLEDIEDIYHGKDRWCRCGCGGKYFDPGERGFKMALTALAKLSVRPEDVRVEDHWINISDPNHDNKAYTIYFKREVKQA